VAIAVEKVEATRLVRDVSGLRTVTPRCERAPLTGSS
jgi:hypothetical protein